MTTPNQQEPLCHELPCGCKVWEDGRVEPCGKDKGSVFSRWLCLDEDIGLRRCCRCNIGNMCETHKGYFIGLRAGLERGRQEERDRVVKGLEEDRIHLTDDEGDGHDCVGYNDAIRIAKGEM